MGKLFGTDGIRGEANKYPMDAGMAFSVGQALTRVLKDEGRHARIVIGKDTRISGYMIEGALEAGITSMGGSVEMTGVLPTPGIAYLAAIVAARSPRVVLAAGRPAERALLGAVAAKLAAPVYTLASAVAVGDSGVEVTHAVFGGIAQETVRVDGPVLLVLEGGSAGTGGAAPVEEAEATPLATVRVVETRQVTSDRVDLTTARRIVAAGRGVRAKDDLALVEALAAALQAELGCTRPLAEGREWFTRDHCIGVTGRHVSPALYVAVGISGQLQHAVGARSADVIVAINQDADCPYFREADYAVVGDLYEVVPALTRALA